jgi:hypothetical protein
MPFNFPPADPDAWATWNVTFEPNTAAPAKNQDKTELVRSLEGALGPVTDGDGNVITPDPQWSDLDTEHSQLKVEFVNPNGSKANRGVVRPPAVNKPPASRVVAVELAR